MQVLKSIFVLFLFTFVANIFAENSFEFNPQAYSAVIQTDYIGFTDNNTNEKTGPELYIDDTNPEFFTFIKNVINTAATNNNSIVLLFTNKNSQNHGQYNCIIPES